VKHAIQDWSAIMFALIYHDVVYNILKKDNEVQSAKFASKVLM
jgi:predicted metal-dependent HD superfamily phosphohydrolase